METINAQIQDWIDYKGSGDKYRIEHDFDCKLTGGNLNADTLISLWLPLRYALNSCNTKRWKRYKGTSNLKKNDKFLKALMKDLPEFISNKELLNKLEKLFKLGRTHANVIILPYRRWNTIRGGKPYWDYFPHFLYDLLDTDDELFLTATRAWIKREHLEMFFDGEICKDNIKDLWGSGSTVSHNPANKKFDVKLLIDNYIDILEQRQKFFKRNCARSK